MTVYVFPGQGSQRKGMGAGLFEKFGELTAAADRLLGYSVAGLCLNDEGSRLTQTQYTQPALYVVNALSYLKTVEERGRPDYVAGHSLGEYNALFAAGAFDFETGLRLVQRRGALMGRISGGGMAAVVGLAEAEIRRMLEAGGLDEIDVANYNAPGQIIISGPKEAILRAKPVFEAAGSRCALLPVSGAFHSRHMEPAREEFTDFLRGFDYGPLQIPVISNVEADLYAADRIVELLSLQLTRSVRWSEGVQFLLRRGEAEFIEVGPGNVLTKLIEKVRREPLPAAPPAPQAAAEPNRDVRAARQGAEESRRVHESDFDARAAEGQGMAATTLGDDEFKRDYGIKYAYLAGGLDRGVSSTEFVVRLARAGLLGYFGTGGLGLAQVEAGLGDIGRRLKQDEAFGVSLVCNASDQQAEESVVGLLLRHGVRYVDAVCYIQVTPALVLYRLKGLSEEADGRVVCRHKVLARVSRPEVAEVFLSPPPERIVKRLLSENRITRREAELAARVPVADDLCVESDAGWHSDQGASQVLLPVLFALRDELKARHGYSKRVRVGVAEGIGTPSAVAAAFVLGADFVLTGTLNQCSVEAALSDAAKDMLERAEVQDTEYAPAHDRFELGAKLRVLKKGLLFPARANNLYELYRRHESLEEIEEKTSRKLQERYFGRSFAEVYSAVRASAAARQVEEAERNPKHKMALVFKWYLEQGQELALSGDGGRRVDYQLQCEPALGAFNHWAKGTPLEHWRGRHVDGIADGLMQGAADFFNQRFQSLAARGQ